MTKRLSILILSLALLLTQAPAQLSKVVVIGEQGPAGPAGATGPAGPAGADGADGADGSDANVTNANVNTAIAADAAATRTAAGMGNVDNTSDANKPVSMATQTALDGKADADLGNVSGLTASEQDAFVDALDFMRVQAAPHAAGEIGAKFPSGPATSLRVGIIGDSFGARITPLSGIVKPWAGQIREGGFNYQGGAGDDSSYAISPCSKLVTIPAGGSVDFGVNGSAANCFGIRVVWLVEPGAGTVTVKRKVGAGAFTTLNSASADGTLAAASFDQNFIVSPTGGFSTDDCFSTNTIRVEASGGTVRGVMCEFRTASAGYRQADLRATTGIDWDLQLAAMDVTAAAALVAAQNLDVLVYSFADDPDNTKWDAYYAALRAAAPDMQIILVGPHAIGTAHANYNYNETAAKSCRRWCKENGVPLFDTHARIPSYAVGQAHGIFDGVDLLHTTTVGKQAIATAFAQWAGFQGLIQSTAWQAPYNATGAQMPGVLEIVGSLGELRFYDQSAPAATKYWRQRMTSSAWELMYRSDVAFRAEFNGSVFDLVPSNVNGNSRLGKSTSGFGEAWLNGISVGITTSTTASPASVGVKSHTVLCDATGGAYTQTIPAASTLTKRVLVFKKTDASGNAVTLDPNSSETIDGATTRAISTQYQSVMIQSDGSNWWVLSTN